METWTRKKEIYTSSLFWGKDELVYEQEIHDRNEILYRSNPRIYAYHQPLAEFTAQGPSTLLPSGFELFDIPHELLTQLVKKLDCAEAKWWRLRNEPKCTLSIDLPERGYGLNETLIGTLLIKDIQRPLTHKGLSLMFRIPPGNSGRPIGKSVQLLPPGTLAPQQHTIPFKIQFPSQHTRGYCLNLIACLDLLGGDDPEVIWPAFYADKPKEEELLGTETSLRKLPPPTPRSDQEPLLDGLIKMRDELIKMGTSFKHTILGRLEKTTLPWLNIEFEKKDHFFYTNEELRGKLLMQPNEPLKYNGIKVSTVWEVKTLLRKEKREQTTLQSRHITGEQLERQLSGPHPRSFQLPAFQGPYTYKGKSIEIECFLKIYIDIPWGFDPELRIPLRVEPSPMTEEENTEGAFGSLYQPPQQPNWTREIPQQKAPALKLDALTCRAGSELTLTVRSNFTTKTLLKARLLGLERAQLPTPVVEEIHRGEAIDDIEAGEQRTLLRLTVPTNATRTLMEKSCSILWCVEVDFIIEEKIYSERFPVTVMPALKDANPYR
jgi:hypothetical protein